ncbi:UDP-N-acetylhexosamine pyrophosphorylase-like [Hydractinia symbiolongicarpus]|uniref:UDP-N-acetylhexosamine pyrophosphorylase-like n=1 Tax=Hydractinia symbiolongicarpus TaxID=13093 RepID=UPI00254AA483|nr:UDP-N-acetylhexosamine pyrophosphorylase-like [Hydractinia symbiolongicarpus]
MILFMYFRSKIKMSKAEVETMLKKHGQEHLLKFWDTLSEEKQNSFLKELQSIDFTRVETLAAKAQADLSHCQDKKDDLMECLPKDVVQKKSAATEEERQKWWDDGLKGISEGTVAVILLAGGQGTRLGVNYPKGMYDVGLPSKKTLYQLQAERINKLQQLAEEKYGKKCAIRWYIMTSAATLKSTVDYFQENSYFGLEQSNVNFFEQHQLPCLTFEGKLILSSTGSVAKSPDGNGGLYYALKTGKILEDMEKFGVKQVFVYCVDNILVKVADPHFIGFCIQRGVEASNKVIIKEDPNESVGVVCKCEGKYQVVEYSEISPATAEKRNQDGSLTYKDSNICLHFFTLDFLKKIISNHLDDLPHHIAKKKIPLVNEEGEVVKPSAPNGMKLEKFVFDVFQFTDKFAVFEVDRQHDFSPLKNGPDTPKASAVSCKLDTFRLHRSYLEAAGATFDDSVRECEISPLLSYGGEGLHEYKGKHFTGEAPIHLQIK